MPHALDTLARRIARHGRRITALERGSRRPRPAWRDLPLTGNTTVPDPRRPPQMRLTPSETLELSGQIGLTDERAVDEAVCALLPEHYRPAVPRILTVASDVTRATLNLELAADGTVMLHPPAGRPVQATWLSLDGLTCRLDGP